jgi:hypothetical protein
LLFPGGSLQERVENVSGFYAEHDKEFLHSVYQHSKGLPQGFCVLVLDKN